MNGDKILKSSKKVIFSLMAGPLPPPPPPLNGPAIKTRIFFAASRSCLCVLPGQICLVFSDNRIWTTYKLVYIQIQRGDILTHHRSPLHRLEKKKKNKVKEKLDKKNPKKYTLTLSPLFINILLEPVPVLYLDQGVTIQKNCLKGFLGHTQYSLHFVLKKSTFFSGRGVDPPPP